MSTERLARLSRTLKENDLDVVAMIPGSNLFYFTGLVFHLMERPIVGLFSVDERPCLVLPELERAKAESAGLEVDLISYGEDEISRVQAFGKAASDRSLDGRRIAVEPTGMRFLELRLLQTAAPRAEFVSAEAALAPLRMTKDEAEIAAMRRAVAIAERALGEALPQIRRGMTERELANELTLQLLRAGSEPALPFDPIVASGPNSALPHAVPGERRLDVGDLLILDWGATHRGYISDLTRTFAVAAVDPKSAHVHDVVAEANAAARAAVRPGATCGEVDKAAREVIATSGYGDRFIHRTGHGIGLEAHEGPYIREGDPLPLAPGMAFTIEPGIYLPGQGGVRVEDDVLVSSTGGESLSGLARELQVIG